MTLRTRIAAMSANLPILLAAVAPHCFNCARPATKHNATKNGGDAATQYACDAHVTEGRWNDLPAANAIRWAEEQEKQNADT